MGCGPPVFAGALSRMEAAGSGRGGVGRPVQRKSRYRCREAPCRALLVTCSSQLSPILRVKQRKLVEGHTAGKQGSCDPSPDRDCQTTEPEFDHCLQPRGQVLTWAQSWAVGPGRLRLAMTPSEEQRGVHSVWSRAEETTWEGAYWSWWPWPVGTSTQGPVGRTRVDRLPSPCETPSGDTRAVSRGQ